DLISAKAHRRFWRWAFSLKCAALRAIPARVNLLHTLPGFFSGVVAKAFPYGPSCSSNDRFLAEYRNLLRYNMADIETATKEIRALPHVRQPDGRTIHQ